MRLTKIHIDGFGKLSDYTLTPSPGFQLLYGGNEAGKSTLCAFLCAMFYAMPNDRKGAGVRENLRTRYAPWNGSTFGGSVELVADDGRAYRIERVFGETKRKDKTTVRDCETWEPLEIEPDAIGRRFLGLGREAFLNTLCTGQLGSAMERQRDDELLARLAGLEQPGGAEDGVERAERALKSAQTALRTDTGRAGALPRLEEEIAALKTEKVQAKRALERYQEDVLERNRLRTQEAALRQSLAALSAQKEQAARYEDYRTYRRLTDELHELEQRLGDGRYKAAKQRLAEAEQKRAKMERFANATKQDYLDAVEYTKEREHVNKDLAYAMYLYDLLDLAKNRREEVKCPKPVNVPMLIVAIAVIAAGVAGGLLFHVLLWALVLMGLFLGAVSFLSLPDYRKARKEMKSLDQEIAERTRTCEKYDIPHLRRKRNELIAAEEKIYQRLKVKSDQEILEGMSQYETLKQACDHAEREVRLIAETRAQTEADIKQKRDARDALGFTPEEAASCEAMEPPESLDQQLADTNGALLACATSLRAAEMRIEQATAGTRTTAELEEAIERARAQERELRLRYDALTLALNTLRDCFAQQKRAFAPVLSANVLSMLRAMSDGHYDDVRVADDYAMAVRQVGTDAVRDADCLSGGTQDLVYLALRLGMIQTVMDGRAPFLLLDDSFTQYDASRVRQSYALLQDAFPQTQILYFTCHESLRQLLPEAEWREI